MPPEVNGPTLGSAQDLTITSSGPIDPSSALDPHQLESECPTPDRGASVIEESVSQPVPDSQLDERMRRIRRCVCILRNDDAAELGPHHSLRCPNYRPEPEPSELTL